jgi:PKD repeat protein
MRLKVLSLVLLVFPLLVSCDTSTAPDNVVIDPPIVDPVTRPKANFAASPTRGNVSLTVLFADQSTGDISRWLWRFGDGSTSNERSPRHTYTEAGVYTVSLTTTGPTDMSSSKTRTNYIRVEEKASSGGGDGGGGGETPSNKCDCSKLNPKVEFSLSHFDPANANLWLLATKQTWDACGSPFGQLTFSHQPGYVDVLSGSTYPISAERQGSPYDVVAELTVEGDGVECKAKATTQVK